MTSAIEVYRRLPSDKTAETALISRMREMGGKLEYQEDASLPDVTRSVCYTFEFTNDKQASDAATEIRKLGDHVEGPFPYGE